jgi:hypothetical protein
MTVCNGLSENIPRQCRQQTVLSHVASVLKSTTLIRINETNVITALKSAH